MLHQPFPFSYWLEDYPIAFRSNGRVVKCPEERERLQVHTRSGLTTSGAPTSGAPTSGVPTSGAPEVGTPEVGAPEVGAPEVVSPERVWTCSLSLSSGHFTTLPLLLNAIG